MRWIAGLLLFLTFFPGAPAMAADAPRLGLPVQCEMGRDCFIQQYFDTDPGPGAADYTCGPMSYDGHRGTDFRVRDRQMMRDGVPVIAAADGVVVQTRDGMDDVDVSTIGRESLQGNDCGNRVGLRHEGGWLTDYCHLRKGSVAVGKGDRVRKGDVIGKVGMSGAAEFPHVHFSLYAGREIIDPFRSHPPEVQCGETRSTFWDPALAPVLAYRPGGILDAGLFNRADLTWDDAKEGRARPETLERDSAALLIWTVIYGIRKDDVLQLRITGPDGAELFANRVDPHPRNQAQAFRFSGKRLRAPLAPGRYQGLVQLIRDGRVYDAKAVSAEVR
ncbi:MAG: M23 family metallopeptidase [Minwuia sp.]|uniref:M23 family metallopeptidase n=1 Tax=Minwuia sp. TaxID=2493630 RepID=UPI003A83DA75